jgi:hypothetical protein
MARSSPGVSSSPKPPASAPRTTPVPPAAPKANAPAAAAATATAAAAASQNTAGPTLDLAGLEQRLRETHAIGVFTKLSLKNQVDDLLGQFRSFHQGQSRNTLQQLRQSYEGLLLKVVSVLQSGDPQLASAVSASRDAIWALLSDPKKFAEISARQQELLCTGFDTLYS